MTASDKRLLTFDVVGTLIDFESGIVTYCTDVGGCEAQTETILAAFGEAEGEQHGQPRHGVPRPVLPNVRRKRQDDDAAPEEDRGCQPKGETQGFLLDAAVTGQERLGDHRRRENGQRNQDGAHRPHVLGRIIVPC